MIFRLLLKGKANVLLTLAFFLFCGWWLVVGGWWLFIGRPEQTREREDPIYASQLFEGLLPVEEVIASRRYHPRGAEAWDCTNAIVRLTNDTPETPPSRVNKSHLGSVDLVPWDFLFGGAWDRTPAPASGPNTRDALDLCSKYWPVPVGHELKSVLYGAGGWFYRDQVGETLFVYARKQRLAARVRFGD